MPPSRQDGGVGCWPQVFPQTAPTQMGMNIVPNLMMIVCNGRRASVAACVVVAGCRGAQQLTLPIAALCTAGAHVNDVNFDCPIVSNMPLAMPACCLCY
jgi:hypothetical protein